MRRLPILLVAAMLAVAPAATAQVFGWTISNSTTDPGSNSGAIAPGPSMFAGNLYLWLVCDGTSVAGMAAAEMDVVELRGAGPPTGFTTFTGFLNAGNATALLLAVGGCPFGPLLAGAFSVGPDAFIPDIELCLVPSAANDRNITVACGGIGYDNVSIGFAKTGGVSCDDSRGSWEFLCVDPASTEDRSWGGVKSLYR